MTKQTTASFPCMGIFVSALKCQDPQNKKKFNTYNWPNSKVKKNINLRMVKRLKIAKLNPRGQLHAEFMVPSSSTAFCLRRFSVLVEFYV